MYAKKYILFIVFLLIFSTCASNDSSNEENSSIEYNEDEDDNDNFDDEDDNDNFDDEDNNFNSDVQWIFDSSWYEKVRPKSELIKIERLDDDYVIIEGLSNSIIPIQDRIVFDRISIINLDTGSEACYPLSYDGSFNGKVFSPENTTLLIVPEGGTEVDLETLNWLKDNEILNPENFEIEGNESGFCGGGRGDGLVIYSNDGNGNNVAYGRTISDVIFEEYKDGAYTIPENYWKVTKSENNIEIEFFGNYEDYCIKPQVKVEKVFDEEGNQVGFDENIHGHVLTPTGFGIEIQNEEWIGPNEVSIYNPFGLSEEEEDCLDLNSNIISFNISNLLNNYKPGYYRYKVMPFGGDGGLSVSEEPFSENNGVLLGFTKIGNPKQPEIPLVLFAETASLASGGSKGIVSEEKKDTFYLGSRVTHTVDYPIYPLVYNNYNEKVIYNLAPWLPSLGVSSNAGILPEVPFINIDAKKSNIVVDVFYEEKKIHSIDAPLSEAIYASQKTSADSLPIYFDRFGSNHSNAGPASTYGLAGEEEDYLYTFDNFGEHVLKYSGTIYDYFGTEYVVDDTFTVFIAQDLDIEMSTYPSTPMIVGDEYNFSLNVFPPMEAKVVQKLTYFPYSNVSEKIEIIIEGYTNHFGQYISEETYKFNFPGEYRVDTFVASTSSTTQFAGSRTAASVISTAKPKINVFGDSLAENNRRWYFTNVLFDGCGDEGQPNCDGANNAIGFPVFSGDIAWFAEGSHIQAPTLSLSNSFDVTSVYPMGIVSKDGLDPLQNIESISNISYFYESVQKPSVSVQQRALIGCSSHCHWYTSDNYNQQHGVSVLGDDPNDYKYLFGGVVIKKSNGEVDYSYYAASDIVIKQGTELGMRVCDPLRGVTGGVTNCGSLMEVDGIDVDLFFDPTSIKPGSVYKLGEQDYFSGQLLPSLNSKIIFKLTKPSGKILTFEDRATEIGYVFNSSNKVTFDEVGVYEVQVSVIHDQIVPSTGKKPQFEFIADGETTMDYYEYSEPLSAILGSKNSRFHFFVTDNESPIINNLKGGETVKITNENSYIVNFEEFQNSIKMINIVLTIPGLILLDQEIDLNENSYSIDLNNLKTIHPNFTNWDNLVLSIGIKSDEDNFYSQKIYLEGFQGIEDSWKD